MERGSYDWASNLVSWASDSAERSFGLTIPEEELRGGLDECFRFGWLRTVDQQSIDEVQALLAAPTPLAFWRAKRGMTQAALAKAARTTQPHVADLESGKHRGSLEVMARIAKALDISVDNLVGAD